MPRFKALIAKLYPQSITRKRRDNQTMRWFGPNWGAPVCLPGYHAETPVGIDCTDCHKPIQAGDSGLILPSLEWGAGRSAARVEDAVFHRECFLRSLGV